MDGQGGAGADDSAKGKMEETVYMSPDKSGREDIRF